MFSENIDLKDIMTVQNIESKEKWSVEKYRMN